MCNKHVHADLMLEYAKDAQETTRPWERWEYNRLGRWIDLNANPRWDIEAEYRRKRKTHIVNGKEVAAPLDKVVKDQTVWSFSIISSRDEKITEYWVSTPSNWEWELSRGLLFATKEDAQENFNALFPPRTLKA